MKKVQFTDLGRMAFAEAWQLQTELHQALIHKKLVEREMRKEGLPVDPPLHHLLFCEHDPVFTLGKSGSSQHLLLSESSLKREGFSFFKINRGGDITYHGPGQLVGYPIFDLDDFFTDVHRYVRFLEEAVIRTLATYGLQGFREKGFTGVWLHDPDHSVKRKICAIGVHLSRWVTLHGFAFNVNTQLDHFDHIVPCGIQEKGREVTSMARELGREIPMAEIKDRVRTHLADLFEYEYTKTNEEGYSPAES